MEKMRFISLDIKTMQEICCEQKLPPNFDNISSESLEKICDKLKLYDPERIKSLIYDEQTQTCYFLISSDIDSINKLNQLIEKRVKKESLLYRIFHPVETTINPYFLDSKTFKEIYEK